MPRRSLSKSARILIGPIGLALMLAAGPTHLLAAAAPPVALDASRHAGAVPMGRADKGSTANPQGHANFLGESPSPEARRVADWAISSGDNGGLPFVVIDKVRARLFVFDSAGLLRGTTMALLGSAHGDLTVPGIGERKLASIRPEERTTPAGRFVAELGRDLQQDILWIDYDAALSLHRVVKGNVGDHRQERLASSSALDKRISYGCINVPPGFYESVVLGAFTGTSGIVYILPEQRRLEDVFPRIARGPGR